MKKLPITGINKQVAELILCDVYENEIWRTGEDQYAFCVFWQKEPIYACESEPFTKLIDCIKEDVLYFMLSKVSCMMCPDIQEMNEIQLLIKCGNILRVSGNGAISIAQIVEY